MSSYKERLSEFQRLLEKDEIDLKELKTLCFNGVPDDSGYRPICWRLLLNYLPSKRSLWPSVLKRQRDLYAQFVEEMIVQPGAQCIAKPDSSVEDHPLNPNPDSKWMTFFRDNEVLLQIDKDVRRLCPDISFFQQATEFPCKQIVDGSQVEALRKRIAQTALASSNIASNRMGIITNIELPKRRTANEEYVYLEEGQEAHWEVVERILFIYAKLNPGQSYVQGMNEIIGPLYYTFACDPNPEYKCYAEADCFFCFTHLMSEIRDFFIKSLDDSSTGIGAMMSKLMEMLKSFNYQLWLRLEEQELKPQFYSFRWITLLLSQEFPLPDVIRVWDSLLSDDYRFSFLNYVCCAMLCLLSDQLMLGDFPNNMKLLQNFPLTDIHKVLAKAVELHRSK